MRSATFPRLCVAAAIVGAALLGTVACQGDSEYKAEPDATVEKPVSTGMGNEALKAEVLAVLSRADELDGQQDHVVSKCAGCALQMDGSAEHVLEVGDYEMHFCSQGCRHGFEEDTEEAIVALSLPESS